MNTIPTDQNESKQLDRLAAQRRLYSLAKQVIGTQIALAVPVSICISLAVLFIPELKSMAGFAGLLIASCDLFLVQPWHKALREKAAKIQEVFDCEVLHLEWNDLKAGRKPDPELIKKYADAYAPMASSYPALENWYPPIVGELPIEIARIVCQRSNCWWDGELRRRFAILAILASVFTIVTILGIGFLGGLTVEKLFLTVITPSIPAIILGFRLHSEQSEAVERIEKLKDHSVKLWSESLTHQNDAAITARSRALQDEILEHRKRSPLVPDWVFKLLRGRQQPQMNHAAEELVADANIALSRR